MIKARNQIEVPRKQLTFASFKRNFGSWILMVPTLLILYFWIIRPIISGIWYSFHSMRGYEVLDWVGLENYKNVISDTQFVPILINTCKYVIWSLILGYLPPLVAAIMLNEMVHAKGYFKFSIYFPVMVSTVATAMIWNCLYQPDANGLLNMLLAKIGIEPLRWLQNEVWTIPLIMLSSTWKSFGGTMIMYLASLQGINQELYEAAMMDGAGVFRRIFSVTLPSIKNMLLLFAVQQMIAVFQIFAEPLNMTGGGPNGASMTLGLWNYNNAFINFKPENALAIGVIMFLILMVMTSIYTFMQNKLDTD